jgi:hypothetical protein
MKLYRFSPILDQEQLMEAIQYTHAACAELCHKAFGQVLPNAGNIGIFCHYDNEYIMLTKLRQELTEPSDNFNQKYFRLHDPITIPANGGTPEVIYSYLYIRKPDPYRAQVGDVDFYLEQTEYENLKRALPNGARIFERPELDMIELYNPDIDALAYVSTHQMTKKVRAKQ